MQSFLQYRCFGKQVARQYERDKSKAEALVNHENSDLTLPSESNAPNTLQINLASDPIDTQDPEKGEQSNGQQIDAQLRARSYDPEKEEGEEGGQG